MSKWLIWSHEHNGWWRPGRCGYTYGMPEWRDAGRYTEDQAQRICADATCWQTAEMTPQEVMVAAPEGWPADGRVTAADVDLGLRRRVTEATEAWQRQTREEATGE